MEEEPLLLRALTSRSHPEIDYETYQHDKASISETVFIILSIFLGLGLLNQPYAISLGGWFSLFALLATCIAFTLSALLLVKVCDFFPSSTSLPFLGGILAGEKGTRAVTAFACFELFGSIIIALAVLIQQIELLLPSEGILMLSNPLESFLFTSIGLISILSIRNVSSLSLLASLGSFSSVVVVVAVLSLVFIDPTRERMPQQPPADHSSLFLFPGILQSIGIFSLGMSGHSSLPGVRSAMRDPSRFPLAVCIAFGIMAALYSSVAAAGYYYFGDNISPVVTFDISVNSPFASKTSMGSLWRSLFAVDRVVAVLVIANCSAKVPLLILVVQDMLFPVEEKILLDPGLYPWYKVRGYVPRLWIAVLAISIAVLSKRYLGNVLSLVGGIASMTVSMILPLMLYRKLYWNGLNHAQQVGVVGMTCLGVALLLLVTAINIFHMVLNKQ